LSVLVWSASKAPVINMIMDSCIAIVTGLGYLDLKSARHNVRRPKKIPPTAPKRERKVEIAGIMISAERLAHPRRDGSLKIRLAACRRRMERLVLHLLVFDVGKMYPYMKPLRGILSQRKTMLQFELIARNSIVIGSNRNIIKAIQTTHVKMVETCLVIRMTQYLTLDKFVAINLLRFGWAWNNLRG
jgi:hypothetical protein